MNLIERLRGYAPLGDGSMWSQPSKDYQLAADLIEELDLQNRQLKESLYGWRQRAWPGTDQRRVVDNDFPELVK